MRRSVAVAWHASFSVVAAGLYFFFVLPRWFELMGQTSPTLGTALRIVTAALIGLAASIASISAMSVAWPEQPWEPFQGINHISSLARSGVVRKDDAGEAAKHGRVEEHEDQDAEAGEREERRVDVRDGRHVRKLVAELPSLAGLISASRAQAGVRRYLVEPGAEGAVPPELT